MTLLELPVPTLDGGETTLTDHAGEVLLAVNVASRCGFTPQYAGLEQLHETYREQGFSVLGFPCNQFLFQEPGDAGTITACTAGYGVTFPVFGKVKVRGRGQHPLFTELVKARDDKGRAGLVRWNFEKFLVGRDGTVLRRYRTGTAPEQIATDVEAALTGQPLS